jgi:class 3 adenylate cyclase
VRDLPRGTVTFLFTDVEGSTRLLKELGGAYGDVLAEHQRILRLAFEAAGGQEIDTQGDSFFVAFRRAKDAVQAAVAGQRALATHRWPQGAAVRVRMGLHTGEPTVGSDRYVGLGVHKAARIAAAAHGGQVLLSNTTRELAEDELPSDVSLVDLGEHELKDIDRPERIFQLRARGLSAKFPPLRLEAPLPRTRALRRPGRIPRRTLLAAAAALALAGLAAGIALALTGGEDATRSPEPAETSGASGPTAPGRDPQTIVPGSSIGALRIGMTESDVEGLYGEGRESQWRSAGKTGTKVTFPAPAGVLFASFFNGKVIQIGTTSSYYRTDDGIHVGSLPPYPGGVEAVSRREAALRTGELEEVEPGVYSWRGFVYESFGYCLRGNETATQLLLSASLARVIGIFVTDAGYLADLPAFVAGRAGHELYCSVQPLER